MIEDGPEPLPEADPEDHRSSTTINDGPNTMENGPDDDMRTLTDPVGCASFLFETLFEKPRRAAGEEGGALGQDSLVEHLSLIHI